MIRTWRLGGLTASTGTDGLRWRPDSALAGGIDCPCNTAVSSFGAALSSDMSGGVAGAAGVARRREPAGTVTGTATVAALLIDVASSEGRFVEADRRCDMAVQRASYSTDFPWIRSQAALPCTDGS